MMSYCLGLIVSLSLFGAGSAPNLVNLTDVSPAPTPVDFIPTTYDEYLAQVSTAFNESVFTENVLDATTFDQALKAVLELDRGDDGVVTLHFLSPQSSIVCGARNCPLYISVSSEIEKTSARTVYFDGQPRVLFHGNVAVSATAYDTLNIFFKDSTNRISVWSGSRC